MLNLQMHEEEGHVPTYAHVPGAVIQADVGVHPAPRPQYPTLLPPEARQPPPVHPNLAPSYPRPPPPTLLSAEDRGGVVGPQPSFNDDTVVQKPKAEEEEEDDDKKKKDEEYFRKVSFFELFRFTTACERVLICFAIVCSIANGAALPIFTLFFKDLIDSGFGGSGQGVDVKLVEDTSLKFLYLALGLLVSGTIASGLLLYVAAGSGSRLRSAYLAAILRQDIGWFDVARTGELTTSIERDCANVQAAVGEKIAIFVQNITTFIGGLIIGFTQGWEMSLVLMGSLPILAGAGAWMAINLSTLTTLGEKSYRGAGGVAEQAISGIRTVQALSGQDREKQRYAVKLREALQTGLKKARINGTGFGVVMGSFIGTYALGLWFGSWLIINERTNTMTGKPFTGGDVIMCFFAIVMGSFSIGQVGPAVQAFAKGQSSAARVYDVLDRKPPIDVNDKGGEKPASVHGNIELQNVAFTYPARPDAPIFKNLSVSIKAGTEVALVGASGSGKSTIIQLVELIRRLQVLRFYDPTSGVVKLDGKDLRSLNLQWLRKSLGLVSQEPVLFARSILENIRFGKEDATLAEVEAACEKSNAAHFIGTLPQKYDTMCGERGAQLSGGQKQRIAIARAIISNPKILLLDEATSALDSESEKLVQAALDNLMSGRTVLVVAHRLSTIRNADNIIVFQKGEVVEQGTHDSLIKIDKGYYKDLVSKQMMQVQTAESSTNLESLLPGSADYVPPIAREHSAGSKGASHDGAVNQVQEKKKDAPKKGKYVSRSFALNKPEFPWVIVGVAGAMMNGAVFPVLATLLVNMLGSYFLCIKVPAPSPMAGQIISVYGSLSDCHSDCYMNVNGSYFTHNNGPLSYKCDKNWNTRSNMLCMQSSMDGQEFVMRSYTKKEACFDEMSIVVRDYSLGFMGLAFGAFLANFLQLYSFGVMGENLTCRLRQLTFASLLRQDIGYFDMPDNGTGALVAKLAKDATYVEGAVGTTLGLAIQNMTLMAISLVIAFIRGWMLTLLCFATFPIMVLAQYFQMQFIAGAGGDINKAYQNAAGVASESISAMRTVAAFSCEQKVEDLYDEALGKDNKAVKKDSIGAGIGQGFSMFTMFFLYFCGFAGGAFLMRHHGYTFLDVMTVFFSITFMGMGAGQAAALAPDIGKAKPAMGRIFEVIDTEPPIDAESPDGIKPTQVRGEIELKNVAFRYPSRPESQIFSNLSLKINVGQTVALVGSSGSGKSTIIALVERFYDPERGQVLLDGVDLKQLNLAWLRKSLGLVSQEPVLFATTIMENIRYGKENATVAEITAAAEKANALTFIQKLPGGFETMCGERGTQLSGGQKQRIAIARAIVADPRILLLDEATSALDSQSEKIVQAALDNLMTGRTVIVVAHRLSTIRNADNIVVFKKGTVVEQGRHDDLIAKPNGFYTNLVASQMNAH